MKDWWKFAFGLICGFLGSALVILVSSQPRGQAIMLLSTPTLHSLVVHVAGEAVQPGVYHLSPGSRVQDAINAAGGTLESAEQDVLNLAAYLHDGDRIFIPAQSELLPTMELRSRSNPSSSAFITKNLVNINIATQQELENLPGIGPVLAKEIITYREANGPFVTTNDIQKVSGIGAITYEGIKDLITVDIFP